MDSLKIYDAELLSDEAGIYKISLVENPAFGVTFSCFSEVKSDFQIQDMEQRIVFGPVIIPDVPIIRTDVLEDGTRTYGVKFSRQTIRTIRDKFFREKNIDKTSLNHMVNVDGLFVVSSFIKGDEGIPSGYEHLPDGTWFVGYKVENEKVWDRAKAGDMGFSQEIAYNLIDSGQTITINNFQSMTKPKKSWSKFRSVQSVFHDATGKLLTFAKFASVMTDKGELAYDGSLVVGKEGVTLLTEGNDPQIANGEFVLQTDDERNGLTVVIDNGVVTQGEEPQAITTEAQEGTAPAPADAIAEQIEMKAEQLDALVERVADIVEDIVEDAQEITASEFSKALPSTIESLFASHFAEIKTELKEQRNAIRELNNAIKAPAVQPTSTNSSFTAPVSEDVARAQAFFAKS